MRILWALAFAGCLTTTALAQGGGAGGGGGGGGAGRGRGGRGGGGAAAAQTAPIDESKISRNPVGLPGPAGAVPRATEADYTLKDFKFGPDAQNQVMDIRIHYRTIGTLKKDAAGNATNAVLLMHGTTGNGGSLMVGSFAGLLFNAGQPLDSSKYYLILTDDIGHGRSSKPSDGMRAKFPNYRYKDMINAEYRLLTEALGVNHCRLIIGTSMGAMHCWQWGEMYPDYMDALMPLASLPEEISGRNRMWRQMISDFIRQDPEWKDGNYTTQPHGLRYASQMQDFMGSNPRRQYQSAPTGDRAAASITRSGDSGQRSRDANDVLYAFESSRDYNPEPELEKIKAYLVAVNTDDDLINPGDLGIMEKQIGRVKHGRAVMIPESNRTSGHGSHTNAALWGGELIKLMADSEKK